MLSLTLIVRLPRGPRPRTPSLSSSLALARPGVRLASSSSALLRGLRPRTPSLSGSLALARPGVRLASSSSAFPVKAFLERRHDDVVVDLAGGHHREHLLARVGAEVDDHGTIVDLVGLVDDRLHLFGRLG